MEKPFVPTQSMASEAGQEPGLLRCPESSLWVVMLTVFMDNMADSLLTPMLPSYAKMTFNATHQQIFNLNAFPCISAFFAAVWISRIADKFGRKPVFVCSMLGAGLGALCQGFATSYDMLLAGRTFGGCFLVIATTAKMYLNEVAPGPHNIHTRNEWNARQGAAKAAAQSFGPAVGGGLAIYGINVPSIACCVVEFFSAIVAFIVLEESPVYLDAKAVKKKDKQSEPQDIPTPWLQIVSFWSSNALLSACLKVAPFAFNIYVQTKYQMTPTDIGFAFMFNALFTLLCTRFVKPLGKRLGTRNAAMATSALTALVIIAMPVFPGSTTDDNGIERLLRIFPIVLCLAIANAASSSAISYATSLSDVGDSSLQPFIQSGAMMARQGAKFGASIVAGMLSEIDCFVMSAFLALISVPSCYLLARNQSTAKANLRRKASDYGPEWQDEKGTKNDVMELGEFMAKLLSDRHIKWVSRKSEVRRMLERVVPTLPTDSKEAYEVAFCEFTQDDRS